MELDAMSRTEAKRRFTLDDHAKATAGVECRKDADVIDETPMASIDAVMEAQRDLVDVVHTLRQVVCVKAKQERAARPSLRGQRKDVTLLPLNSLYDRRYSVY
jgi:hypothetical protein